MKAMLVYQAGIANVFEVESFASQIEGVSRPKERGHTRRLLQADFHSCVMFAKGMKAAGASIKVVGCNQAGDIANSEWTYDLESLPFCESFVSKI